MAAMMSSTSRPGAKIEEVFFLFSLLSKYVASSGTWMR